MYVGKNNAGLVTATNGTNPTFVNTIQAEPYGFVLSGNYYGAPDYQGRRGIFWARSSYASDGSSSRYLDFYGAADAQYPGVFHLQFTGSKYVGRAVRCVLPI